MASGRKPLNKREQRNVNLSALFRTAEAKQIRKLAEQGGLTVSTFIRVELRKSLNL